MRIGANSGSLPKHLLELAQEDTAEALVEEALEQVRLLESLDYYDFKISVKSSSVPIPNRFALYSATFHATLSRFSATHTLHRAEGVLLALVNTNVHAGGSFVLLREAVVCRAQYDQQHKRYSHLSLSTL